MTNARAICKTVYVRGTAVLLARIVDGAGVPVRRDLVAFMTYSIGELDPRDSDKYVSVLGHIDVPLDVREVFSDSLETGGLWDADAVGYNFRHEIHADGRCGFPKPGARYEVRYLLQPKQCGEPVMIRFYVRFIPR